MRFFVLGPLQAWKDGRELELGAGRQRALLAFLLVNEGEVVSADRLIDALWAETPPASAAKVVQGYVSQLRRVLGPESISTRGSGYAVEAAETDAAEFEHLLDRARSEPSQRSVATLRSALELWRGRPYADVEYESWAQQEIGRLEELRLVASEELLDARLQLGEAARVVPELEALVAEHPLREQLRALLMLALYRAGRQADALESFADARRRLVDGLGIEPGPELQDLQRRILAQDAELGPPRRPRPIEHVARRARWLVAAGTLLAAAAVAAAFLLSGGTAGIRANSLVLLDGVTGEPTAQIAVGSRPSQITVGAGATWVLNADDNTVSEIDATQHKLLATFSGGLRPVAIAAGVEGLWLANGPSSVGSQVEGSMLPVSLTKLDPGTRAPLRTVPLRATHSYSVYTHFPGMHTLVTGAASVWTTALDDRLVRVDASTGAIVHRFPFGADSLAFGGGELWVVQSGRQILRIDPKGNRVDLTYPLAAGPGIAYGFGSAWVADPVQNQLWRIYPGVKPRAISIAVATGSTAVAVSAGAVWTASALADEVMRVDPATNRVDRTIALNSPPQDLAPAPGGVWVGTGSPPPASGPLPATSCSPLVYPGPGKPRFIVASDLALQGAAGASTRPIQQGIEELIRERGFRAGNYTIGYQSCDDSSVQAGSFDWAKCIANARAYNSDLDVIGVVGTYNSGCSYAEIPILNVARNGPVAMVSPLNTFGNLTVPTITGIPGVTMDPSGTRSFARVIAADQIQYAADAVLMHQLGVKAVAVLDDGSPYAVQGDRWFTYSARRLGLRTVRISWRAGRTRPAQVVAQMRSLGATGLWVAAGSGSTQALAALRGALPTGVPIVVTDWYAVYPSQFQVAGRGLDGIYGSLAGAPNSSLPLAGRRFVDRVGSTLSYTSAFGGAAAQVLLAAIARSDGTRASVTRELFRTRIETILGPIVIDSHGDPKTAAVTIFRLRKGARNDTNVQDNQDAVVFGVITPASRIIPYSR